jgi:Cu/Ag efflux pump CusA
VNPELLLQYDLTALDVFEAISKSNINVGGDVIEKVISGFLWYAVLVLLITWRTLKTSL